MNPQLIEPSSPAVNQVVALRGRLDLAVVPALRQQLLVALHQGGARLVVDMSAVTYCDTTALAMLVATDRRARLLGGSLRLIAGGPVAVDVLAASGLDRYFAVHRSVADAVLGHDQPIQRHQIRPWALVHADEVHLTVTALIQNLDRCEATARPSVRRALADLRDACVDGHDPRALAALARRLLATLDARREPVRATTAHTITHLRQLLDTDCEPFTTA